MKDRIRKAPEGAKPPSISYFVSRVDAARETLDEAQRAYFNAVADLQHHAARVEKE